jgi:endonuclease YncB( thermonuclease family)
MPLGHANSQGMAAGMACPTSCPARSAVSARGAGHLPGLICDTSETAGAVTPGLVPRRVFRGHGYVAYSTARADDFTGRVVGVSDRDTLTVLCGRTLVKIRLHGIDIPAADSSST